MQVVKQQPKKQEPIELPKQDDIQESLAWLENRGISKQIASKTGVVLGKKKYKPVIVFPTLQRRVMFYAVKMESCEW